MSTFRKRTKFVGVMAMPFYMGCEISGTNSACYTGGSSNETSLSY